MSLDTAVQDVIDELLGMWRFRWPALAVAWIIALGGWLWTLQLPDEYVAEARVFVNTDSLLGPLMQGLAIKQNTHDQVALMSRALLSRPNLRAVAIETGLQVRASSPEDLDSMLSVLETNIDFTETSKQKLYTISYRDHDPVMARAVVKSLLGRFMDESLNENQSESQNAQKFIREQLAENEERLITAENRLAEFKKRNVSLMPGRDGDYFQRLKTAKSNAARLKTKINQVELRRTELLRQIEGEEPSFGLMGSAAGLPVNTADNTNSASARRLAELETRVQNLLMDLTEKHPDVIHIREQIAELRAALEKEDSSNTKIRAPLVGLDTLSGSAANGLERNPVYQHMRIELSTGEVELVSLQAQLTEEEGKVSFLRRMVDTIPEVEAELQRLNRDYGVVKSQYETLLGRLESAKLAEKIQQDTKDVTFRVIDPPYVPIAPSGPDRLPLILAVLIAALGTAVALSYLLSQQRPVFFSARKLRTHTGLPVYGVISITKASRRIASHIWFAAGTSGLFALWLLLLVAEQMAINTIQAISSSL